MWNIKYFFLNCGGASATEGRFRNGGTVPNTKLKILQLKYMIKFAQALLKPKGNSSETLHTL